MSQKITRIDLFERPNGTVFVQKFADGWTATCRPVEMSENDKMTMASMVIWLKENGWDVAEWDHGARAWLGKRLPVRNAGQIKKLRERYTRYPAELGKDQLCAVDLAYVR